MTLVETKRPGIWECRDRHVGGFRRFVVAIGGGQCLDQVIVKLRVGTMPGEGLLSGRDGAVVSSPRFLRRLAGV